MTRYGFTDMRKQAYDEHEPQEAAMEVFGEPDPAPTRQRYFRGFDLWKDKPGHVTCYGFPS